MVLNEFCGVQPRAKGATLSPNGELEREDEGMCKPLELNKPADFGRT